MAVKILSAVDDKVQKLFQRSQNIFFFVGSGISVASGIPTFRGLTQMDYFNGWFPQYLSSKDGFQRRTEICWQFFKHMHHLVKEAKPNKAHERIALLQTKAKEKKKTLNIVTLAYDNLLIKAGVKSVLELHGNINNAVCSKCGKQESMSAIELKERQIPTCSCGGIIRPDIVLMEELVKEEIYDKAISALKRADLRFMIGSSGVHEQSKYFLLNSVHDCPTVEINPIPSYLTRECDFAIQGCAENILFQLRFK